MFASKLLVYVPADGGRSDLLAPLVYLRRDGRKFVVPEGYKTDYASVPQLLWNILPPTGRHTYAAVLHDWLYDSGILSRKDSDQVFLEAMEELGVPAWQRTAMWLGVRAGGWAPWNKYRAGGRDA